MLHQKLYVQFNTYTIGAVFLLILVGGVVRSLGAGMGCPDWPKCFGRYIPPASVSELPKNYQEIYREGRIQKNLRVASIFESLGYKKLAKRITSDPTVLREEAFSVSKAWIEYINRLLGALIGLFIIANTALAMATRNKSIIALSWSVLVLTGVQGWLGSLVVSTNLQKEFISFHLIFAFVIVALLIWTNVKSRGVEKIAHRKLAITIPICFLIFVPQIFLGTEVRAIIDGLLISDVDRNVWHTFLTKIFQIHRSYSWLILVGGIFIFYIVRKNHVMTFYLPAGILLLLIVLTMLVGLAMTSFGFAFWYQPLHLILATGIFSSFIYLILRLKYLTD